MPDRSDPSLHIFSKQSIFFNYQGKNLCVFTDVISAWTPLGGSVSVMYYMLYLWLTISHNQQVFHLPVTMELFQCITCCFPSCYRCLLVLIELLNVVVPGFTAFFFVFLNGYIKRFSSEIDSQGGNCCPSQPSAEYWGVFWSVKILMERWCFLQHMYKRTDSSIIGLSDGKEPSSFKCLGLVTMI